MFSKSSTKIYGVMGMIQLLSGPYLVVIVGRHQVGSLQGKALWNVTKVEILPCIRDSDKKVLTERQLDDEEQYVDLIKHFIAVTGIYYSNQHDLTRSCQSQAGAEPSLSQVDSKFFLNRFIAEPFLKAYTMNPSSLVDHFLAICIEGFVELQPTTINGKAVGFGVISRRATGRVGTRHFSRGIDDYGNVSNFVETEQLIISGNQLASFTQIRGSIPIYWRQNANLAYKPPMELYNAAENGKVFKAHFDQLEQSYGQVLAVNLVDHGGWEGILARQFSHYVDETKKPNLKYVHFDFHQNCRKMQWHKISILMGSIEGELKAHGHFLLQDNGRIISRQRGIVRTNCIDCLDRTNVVQSVIGQAILNEQLHEMGLFKPRETIQDHVDLVWFFKNIWADNGDAISSQYAGTGALKSDYTRTGERTKWGLIQDGIKSMIRYHKSNFTDGYRQDAMDLFHGRYIVSPFSPSPFGRGTVLSRTVSPVGILGLALVLSYLSALTLSKTGLGKVIPRIFHIPLTLLPASLMLYAIMKNGILFVRYPQLVPPKVVIVAKSVPQADPPSSLFNRKVHQI